MPRARRRRARSAQGRSWGRTVLLIIAATVTVVVVVGSLAAIHTQSSSYRSSTDAGYGDLASRVADASNQTGAQLATLMAEAPTLANQAVPDTARGELQQGLDQAADASSQQATQAAQLVPPYPSGSVSDQFTQALGDRATATSDLRTAIDQLLGMSPLPVAGAPTSIVPSSSAPLIAVPQATAAMSAAGALFEHADDVYRSLMAGIRSQRLPIRLPRSVWVPSPVGTSPLGAVQLGAAASSLASSVPLIPFHRLAITAVGLVPPAVSSGGVGVVGGDCAHVQSSGPGATPTVLPPTSTITAEVTVTNCGTVPESGVTVSQELALNDTAGAALPAPAARGSASHAIVSLGSGSSSVVPLAPMVVASGHRYTLTMRVALPVTQVNPAGSTQQFVIQISD